MTLVGDEAMFGSLEAGAACDITLAMVERFTGDPAGPTVNLAARLADAAVPGELLATTEVAEATTGRGLRFGAAGRRLLKGFGAPITTPSVARG